MDKILQAKKKYNEQLARHKKGTAIINENYSSKAHNLLISIGVTMDALIEQIEKHGVEVSQKEYEQGFKI